MSAGPAWTDWTGRAARLADELVEHGDLRDAARWSAIATVSRHSQPRHELVPVF